MTKIKTLTFFSVFFILLPLCFAGGEHKTFNLGDFDLESGVILPKAKLSYVTHGELNKKNDNLILVPSAYLGIIMVLIF